MAGSYEQQTAAYSPVSRIPPQGRAAAGVLLPTQVNCLDDACVTAKAEPPAITLDTTLPAPRFTEGQSVDPTGFNGDFRKVGRPGLHYQWYRDDNYLYQVLFVGLGRHNVISVESLNEPSGKAILRDFQNQEEKAKGPDRDADLTMKGE